MSEAEIREKFVAFARANGWGLVADLSIVDLVVAWTFHILNPK